MILLRGEGMRHVWETGDLHKGFCGKTWGKETTYNT